MRKGDWGKIDEEKCILGVGTTAEARELYLAHYDDPRFCGSIKELSMDRFKQRLATKGIVGEKIASAAQRIAELNYMRMQQGDDVLVGGHGVKVGFKTAAEGDPDPSWDNDIARCEEGCEAWPRIRLRQRRSAIARTR